MMMMMSARHQDLHNRGRLVGCGLLLFAFIFWFYTSDKNAFVSSHDPSTTQREHIVLPTHSAGLVNPSPTTIAATTATEATTTEATTEAATTTEDDNASSLSSPTSSLTSSNYDKDDHDDDNAKPPRTIFNTTLPFIPSRTMYSVTRMDRSGAAITDMLLAHAMAFANGWQYGGACGARYGEAKEERKEQVQALLDDTGLDKVLRFACPAKNPERKSHYLSSNDYLRNEKKYLRLEWLQYMRRAVRLYSDEEENDGDKTNIYRIAVHIRRGDVSLCSGSAWQRYLPNSHYLRILDRIKTNVTATNKDVDVQVTIFSESPDGRHAQYEGFEEFEQRGYRLHLDGDLREVWKGFITADALVLAQSTFGMVPAILRFDRPGTYFCPFKHAHALDHWYVISDADMQLTDQEMDALQRERCPQKGDETDREKYFAKRDTFLGYDD